MGSPTIFSGSRTKLLTSKGLLLKNGTVIDYDGDINYITATDGSSLGAWATYADVAGASPVDGTGGSANVTFATSTNSDLRGTTNFLFTHDAADRQGQGFSYNFTIDKADQAKMLQVKFDYLVASGTYADGDLTVWIYDVTNATLIQPAPYRILNAVGAQPWIAEFQTASNSTSYRVIFHVTTTTATAYTMRFDNFSVGPQSQRAYGTPVTDWVSYTPTGSWTSGVTSYTGKWRRVGDAAEFDVTVLCSGAVTAAALTITLPSGMVIDTSKLTSTTADVVHLGTARVLDSGAQEYGIGYVKYASTTSVTAQTSNASATYLTSPNITNTVPMTFGANDTVQLLFKAPIAGWSSNTVMSSDAATNVVAATTGSTSAITLNANVISVLGFSGKGVDTNNAITLETGSFTASTGQWTTNPKWTAPVSGYYLVQGTLQREFTSTNTTNTHRAFIYKNGVSASSWEMNEDGANAPNLRFNSQVIRDILLLNAGDYIDFRTQTDSGNGVAKVTLVHSEIYRISGPTQIAAASVVAAEVFRATATANQSIPNTTYTPIGFDNITKETHSAFTTGTSDSYFTIPVSGWYSINAMATFSYNATGTRTLAYSLDSSTTATKQMTFSAPVASRPTSMSGSATFYANAGQRLRILVYQDSGGALNLDQFWNYLSLSRVGGVM